MGIGYKNEQGKRVTPAAAALAERDSCRRKERQQERRRETGSIVANCSQPTVTSFAKPATSNSNSNWQHECTAAAQVEQSSNTQNPLCKSSAICTMGYGLRVTGYGLRATGYGLRATGGIWIRVTNPGPCSGHQRGGDGEGQGAATHACNMQLESRESSASETFSSKKIVWCVFHVPAGWRKNKNKQKMGKEGKKTHTQKLYTHTRTTPTHPPPHLCIE